MSKVYKFKAEVWLYPGLGGWHFVNVPDNISKNIREKYGKGMIKIEAKVGKTSWNTALFPYKNPKGNFGYLVSVKAIVRKKEEILRSDIIMVSFNIL